MALAVVRSILNASKISANNKILLSSVSRGLNRFDVQNTRTLTRSLFYLCRNRDSDNLTTLTSKAVLSNRCGCGCSLHTKGDKELSAFLEEEIKNEMKANPREDLPKLDDFECELNTADVILRRKMDHETITVKINVNNSVDAEVDEIMDPNEPKEQQQEQAEMKSKPEFTVEIQKGKKTLSFLCSFSSQEIGDDMETEGYNDVFQIVEISLYEGEFQDSTYTVSGEIMDGYLYDLLMNYLEERGISNEFAEKMITFCTAYEHKLYVSLLKGMKSFVDKQQ